MLGGRFFDQGSDPKPKKTKKYKTPKTLKINLKVRLSKTDSETL